MASVEIITMWYNEAFLAPFFLAHYAWADRITLLFDEDSTDASRDIAKAYANVKVTPFRFPDMMDDELKADLINKQYRRSNCDWVLSVDADEFAFYKQGDEFCYDLRPFLAENPGHDLFVVTLYQIYRHRSDQTVDPSLPAVPQRRHGDPNITGGINALYNKPILARSGLDMSWGPGCHEYVSHGKPLAVSPLCLQGAHWAMADPDFAVERRVKNRRERQSRNNLVKQMTVQHHNITVKSIMAEFALHANDPQLF
ncbi:MAG: glycosyltransferase family 2 protein [Desulfovibrio sp.]|jgi:hypothetical protein|nr:glycosyltransferase family 2 protein [Desulfovibrio sp.]